MHSGVYWCEALNASATAAVVIADWFNSSDCGLTGGSLQPDQAWTLTVSPAVSRLCAPGVLYTPATNTTTVLYSKANCKRLFAGAPQEQHRPQRDAQCSHGRMDRHKWRDGKLAATFTLVSASTSRGNTGQHTGGTKSRGCATPLTSLLLTTVALLLWG